MLLQEYTSDAWSFSELPQAISGGGGRMLVGIVTRPKDLQGIRGAIVLSHGWSGQRSGPAGLLTRLAREFAQQGYVTLRFDYGGRGESQGDGVKTTLATMSEDLAAAVAWFKTYTGQKNVTLCGLCSGGNVVIGTLPKLKGVNKLLLLSVYPFSDGDSFGRDVHRTFHFLTVYWKKLFLGSTWKRLFSGDISFRGVFNVLFGHFRKSRSSSAKEGALRDNAGTGLPQAVKASKVESRTQAEKEPPKKHLANLLKVPEGILVYGSADPDAKAAMAYYGNFIQEKKLHYDIEVIPGATHNFASPEEYAALLKCLK